MYMCRFVLQKTIVCSSVPLPTASPGHVTSTWALTLTEVILDSWTSTWRQLLMAGWLLASHSAETWWVVYIDEQIIDHGTAWYGRVFVRTRLHVSSRSIVIVWKAIILESCTCTVVRKFSGKLSYVFRDFKLQSYTGKLTCTVDDHYHNCIS